MLRLVFSRANLNSESIYNYSFPKVRIEYNAHNTNVISTAIANPAKISRTISNHVSYYWRVNHLHLTFITIYYWSAFFLVFFTKHKMMFLQVAMFFFPTLSANKTIKPPSHSNNPKHFLQFTKLICLCFIIRYSCFVQLYPQSVVCSSCPALCRFINLS